MSLRVGSLFSGIGGLDLGLERAGMTVVWQSEIDPYASRVLAKHWPDIPNLGDIRDIDWQAVDRVDLVCGGYPCQPFSLAGVRRGDTDPRHLWPHFADALRHLRPRWALLENVPGHLSLGFGRVLGDLAELGYDTEWDCIPAAAVGAPHLRYRIFVVAHANSEGEPGEPVDALTRSGVVVPDAGGDELRQQPVDVAGCSCPTVARHDGENGDVADTEELAARTGLRSGGPGGQRRRRPGDSGRPVNVADTDGPRSQERWARRATHHGDHWAVEPNVGRVAHGVPSRVDRLRTLGNAVVPQVAELIGRRIMEAAA